MKILLYGCGQRGISILESMKVLTDIINITDSSNTAQENLPPSERNLFVKKETIAAHDYDYILITSIRYFDAIKKELAEIIDAQKIISIEEYNSIIVKENRAQYSCNICSHQVYGWLLTGERNELFEQKNVTGAGLRNGICPLCGSTDRLRYEYYILKKQTDIFSSESRILHFAPEKQFISLLNKNNKHYITADIAPGIADVVADITNLQFEDSFFDYMICNHIMEHVKDEAAAFSEIRRCLKASGMLILTVPLCWDEGTYERDDITNDDERRKYYGQSDHERLYGRDIVVRIKNYGLQVNLYKNTDIITMGDIETYGFINGDSILLCRK